MTTQARKRDVKMKINKIKFLDKIVKGSPTQLIDCDLIITGCITNGLTLQPPNPNVCYEITFSPQDIRNLMKWQMGQDEYNDNQRKHKEKQTTHNRELSTTDTNILEECHQRGIDTIEEWNKFVNGYETDIENQKIVDELIKCYRECRARQENLAISEFETNQQLFMEKLYKRATTGKDIKNL